MNFQIVQPRGFLKSYVKQYCFMESDIHESAIKERVIPVDNVQLMFHYENPFIVYHQDNRIVTQPRSIISGLTDTFSDVSTNGIAGVVFVSFYSTGACNFFRFPLSEIENQSISLSDIFSREISQVEEMLYLKNTIEERISVIENFLLKRFSPIPSYDNLLIKRGIEIIKRNKGQTTVSTLSDNLSVTTKSLERKFSQYLGKTTKQVIRLVRFQEVLQDFSADKSLTLTDCAFRNGYFDQAHFIKDFKNYTGFTPKEFITKFPDFNINEAC